MKKGVIATSLARPWHYPMQALAGAIGGSLFSLVAMALPFAVAGALLFRLQPPAGVLAVVVALAVSAAAFPLYFLLWLITGMMTFWFTELPWAIPSFINAVM